MQLDELLDRQQRSWKVGDPLSIEILLEESPELKNQANAVVDLIYAEVLLRESQGEAPVKTEYQDRFPECREFIEKQFQIHQALATPIDQAEVPTDDGDGATLATNRIDARSFKASVPGFELQEMLGRGGSGIAWRARDLKLDRNVAIKFLLDLGEGENNDRLVHEAAAAAKLVHPSIVQVFQVGESEGVPFLVMEYVDGGSLAQKLQSGPLPFDKAVSLTMAVGEAIEHAHSNGVVHRDLKPGNILLEESGCPQVCDFGLARKLDAEKSLHKTGDVIGTPAYMSPEQARGEHADERSDVYSLGAVLYESLCGRSPFQAVNPWEILYQVTTTDPVPLRQLNPSLPIELETICQKCLDKKAERRYRSAKELVADLQRFSDDIPILARPVSAAQQFFKWCRRNRMVSGLSAVSLLLLSALAIGSTVVAFKLSDSNRKVLEEQRLTEEAQQKAINDRTVAVDSLYDLVNAVYDDMVAASMPLETQEKIATAAIEGLQKITDIKGDPASIQTAILAKKRIGEIYAQRGYSDKAVEEFQQALELARGFHAEDPKAFDRKYELIKTIDYLVLHFNRTGQPDNASLLTVEANAILDELLEEKPDDVNVLRRWVVARSYAIDVLWNTKPAVESIALAEPCLPAVQSLHNLSDGHISSLQSVNGFYIRLGRAYMNAGQFDNAEKYLKMAIDVVEEAIELEPERTDLLSTSSVTEKMYALLLGTQCRFEKSVEVFDNALGKSLVAESLNPTSIILRAETANIRGLKVASLTAVGKVDSAIEELEKAIAVYEEKRSLDPSAIVNRRTLLSLERQLCDSLTRQLRFDEAIESAQRMLATLEGGDGVEPLETEYDLNQAWLAEMTINVLRVAELEPMVDPTAEHRAMAAFLVAYLQAKRSTSNDLDDEAIAQVQSMNSAVEIKTIDGLFELGRSLDCSRPIVVALYPLFEARIYATQAQRIAELETRSEQDEARIQQLVEQSLDLLVPFSKSAPNMLNQIYIEPDFIWLRGTEAFASRGLILEGAD